MGKGELASFWIPSPIPVPPTPLPMPRPRSACTRLPAEAGRGAGIPSPRLPCSGLPCFHHSDCSGGCWGLCPAPTPGSRVTGVGVLENFQQRLLGERLAPQNCWLSTHWGEGLLGVLGVDRAGLGPSELWGGGRRDSSAQSQKTNLWGPGVGGGGPRWERSNGRSPQLGLGAQQPPATLTAVAGHQVTPPHWPRPHRQEGEQPVFAPRPLTSV